MKSYIFQVELEPDAEGWRAIYPPLEEVGASTRGITQEEALGNIQDVLSMILEEFNEQDRVLPEDHRMTGSDGAAVSVNL